VRSLFGHAAVVILVPGVLIGGVFPYLLRMSQRFMKTAGKTIGQLAAINTVGAIAGSLAAGFVLLPLVGLWASIRWVALAYLVMAVFAPGELSKRSLALRAAPALGVTLVLIVSSSQIPLVTLNPHVNATLREVWEGANGTVAVVEEGKDLNIKLNNYYNVGGTGRLEQWQARIPLFLHPEAESVFFLGLGTGITAGAALDFPVKRVVACELVPEIAIAARKYFASFTNGLFKDERSEIVFEDGRTYLLGTSESYDVIIGDLFIPWHEGTGTLYAKEHFRRAASRLTEGGLFVQWVPLYQVSKREFFIIVRTMLEVYPQVTLWREQFSPGMPLLALVGQQDTVPLCTEHLRRNVEYVLGPSASPGPSDKDVLPYSLYAGNLTQSKRLFMDHPVNTYDRPVIEYLSPITREQRSADHGEWFTHFQLADFLDELFAEVPPEEDPYLENLSPQQIDFVRAGLVLYKVKLYQIAGMTERARRYYREFLFLIPGFDLHPELR
jgi:spermidine synthase